VHALAYPILTYSSMKRYIAKCYLMALLIMAFVPGAAFADPQLRVEVAILLKHGLPQPSDTSEKPPFSGKQSGEIVVRMELIYSLTLILRNAGTEDLTLVTGGFLPRFSGRRLNLHICDNEIRGSVCKGEPVPFRFCNSKAWGNNLAADDRYLRVESAC